MPGSELIANPEVETVLIVAIIVVLDLIVGLNNDIRMRPEIHTDIGLLFLAGGAVTGLVIPLVVAREQAPLVIEFVCRFDVPTRLVVCADTGWAAATEIPLRIQGLQCERAAGEDAMGLV